MGISYEDKEGLKTITEWEKGKDNRSFLRKAVWGKSSFSDRPCREMWRTDF
jgi:hypothetical protein